jgi:hypothetical protein
MAKGGEGRRLEVPGSPSRPREGDGIPWWIWLVIVVVVVVGGWLLLTSPR